MKIVIWVFYAFVLYGIINLFYTMWNVNNQKPELNEAYQKLKKISEEDCNQNIIIEDIKIGCYNLGVMYFDGKGVKKDKQKAKKLFNKACKNGSIDACKAYEEIN